MGLSKVMPAQSTATETCPRLRCPLFQEESVWLRTCCVPAALHAFPQNYHARLGFDPTLQMGKPKLREMKSLD